MKKWYLIDNGTNKIGEIFVEEMDASTYEEAQARLDEAWLALTPYDRARRDDFSAVYAELDSDGCLDYGTIDDETKVGYIRNEYGTPIYFEAVVGMMDDEIREDLHIRIAPCTNQEFFDEYAKRHIEKFGETWEPAKKNPVI